MTSLTIFITIKHILPPKLFKLSTFYPKIVTIKHISPKNVHNHNDI